MKKSVQICKTLSEVVDFIKKKHTHINHNKGVYALKLIRQPDGTRLPFEEMRGLKIKKITVENNNTLVIEQQSHGLAFRGNKTYVFDARMFLQNLAMINIYDYSAEFLTVNSIDFTYIQQTQQAEVVMLSEWINGETGVVRAQWLMDKDIEKVLNTIGLNHKLRREEVCNRNIDLDINL